MEKCCRATEANALSRGITSAVSAVLGCFFYIACAGCAVGGPANVSSVELGPMKWELLTPILDRELFSVHRERVWEYESKADRVAQINGATAGVSESVDIARRWILAHFVLPKGSTVRVRPQTGILFDRPWKGRVVIVFDQVFDEVPSRVNVAFVRLVNGIVVSCSSSLAQISHADRSVAKPVLIQGVVEEIVRSSNSDDRIISMELCYERPETEEQLKRSSWIVRDEAPPNVITPVWRVRFESGSIVFVDAVDGQLYALL